MITVAQRVPAIVVVDANPGDYAALAPLADSGEIDLRFFLSGRAALRRKDDLRAWYWLINVRLPDWSGFDLCEMLRFSLPEASVVFVADRYRAEEERQALSLGVVKFICKPLDPSLLREGLLT